jgi:xanthine dehydrogenase iron-sulfur cluster and FAD-binding subunit A
MWQTYFQPSSLAEALSLLAEHGAHARLVAGGTDLLVELQRGVRPTGTLIDLGGLSELKYLRCEDDSVCFGALTTHNDLLAWPEAAGLALPLAQACWEVGAPQIRARATIAGNLVTASPANDTITPLLALDASLVLASSRGERTLPLREFYLGVRRTLLAPDELLREIRFPALRADQRGIFLKLGLRRAQAISVINLAIVLTLDGPIVREARIALGSVAPTVVRAPEAEAALVGSTLDETSRREAARIARSSVRPISDLRGGADYRLATVESLVAEALRRLAAGSEAQGFPARAVRLETNGGGENQGNSGQATGVGRLPRTLISTTINGAPHELSPAQGKSLLDLLREDAALTGTKEGCAEGECGACTVWLNGQAVMACLVPAPQAHGAAITTIEGLAAAGAAPGELHPLQAAFIANGAVQCGYCIPGMLMAGAKLLEELPDPSLDEIQSAISGNICRCTGYRKILDAMIDAASRQP